MMPQPTAPQSVLPHLHNMLHHNQPCCADPYLESQFHWSQWIPGSKRAKNYSEEKEKRRFYCLGELNVPFDGMEASPKVLHGVLRNWVPVPAGTYRIFSTENFSIILSSKIRISMYLDLQHW
jgi:hypothetical protein